MKTLNNKSLFAISLGVVVVLFAILQVLIGTKILNGYFAGIIILICINIILAVSLNLSTGFMGQLVLGQAGFMAIGAYVAGIIGVNINNFLKANEMTMTQPLSFVVLIVGVLVGGVVAGIIGVAIGIPALRLRGDYLGIMTLGFGEIVRIVITNLGGITGGAQGLYGVPRISNFANVYWFMIIVVAFVMMLARSRHGRAIISIRENEIAAEAVGISTTKYKVIGFGISATLAGIGGGLFAYQMGYLAPLSFGFMKSVDILVIVVLGGMGSITGSILAAIVFTILPEALRDFASYRMIAYSVTLILVMLFRPQGLFGTHEFSLKTFLEKRMKVNQKTQIKGGEK